MRRFESKLVFGVILFPPFTRIPLMWMYNVQRECFNEITWTLREQICARQINIRLLLKRTHYVTRVRAQCFKPSKFLTHTHIDQSEELWLRQRPGFAPHRSPARDCPWCPPCTPRSPSPTPASYTARTPPSPVTYNTGNTCRWEADDTMSGVKQCRLVLLLSASL